MSTKCSSGAVPGGVLPSFSPWKKKVAARRRRNPTAKLPQGNKEEYHDPSLLRRRKRENHRPPWAWPCVWRAGGKPVVIAQFLKGADSGERYALSLLPKVTLLPAPEQIKFSFQLTPEERAAEQKRYLRLIAQARTARAGDPGRTAGAGRGVRGGEHRPAASGGGALLPGGGGLRGGPHRPGPGPGAAGAGRLCDRDEKASDTHTTRGTAARQGVEW